MGRSFPVVMLILWVWRLWLVGSHEIHSLGKTFDSPLFSFTALCIAAKQVPLTLAIGWGRRPVIVLKYLKRSWIRTRLLENFYLNSNSMSPYSEAILTCKRSWCMYIKISWIFIERRSRSSVTEVCTKDIPTVEIWKLMVWTRMVLFIPSVYLEGALGITARDLW